MFSILSISVLMTPSFWCSGYCDWKFKYWSVSGSVLFFFPIDKYLDRPVLLSNNKSVQKWDSTIRFLRVRKFYTARGVNCVQMLCESFSGSFLNNLKYFINYLLLIANDFVNYLRLIANCFINYLPLIIANCFILHQLSTAYSKLLYQLCTSNSKLLHQPSTSDNILLHQPSTVNSKLLHQLSTADSKLLHQLSTADSKRLLFVNSSR